MIDFLTQPWPWWVSGPLIGLVVPALLLAGGKQFGVSENLRHMCAATIPGRVPFFQYDWKKAGLWNLTFLGGVLVGGFLAVSMFMSGDPLGISEAARASMSELGISEFEGLAPEAVFSWRGLATVEGVLLIIVGGFLVGFGTRYAGGCTSGHAISGLSNLQLPSLIAVIGFFAGGLIATWFILPLILGGGS
ncbi:MAG: YeeE/YedE family protein [Rhodothermales bacterium]|nr:YeeE/YedE family protein [Rhodothermales bacterium]MBO6778843.1 YeeE/YedE family protein [Rhodothermales bacterium]